MIFTFPIKFSVIITKPLPRITVHETRATGHGFYDTGNGSRATAHGSRTTLFYQPIRYLVAFKLYDIAAFDIPAAVPNRLIQKGIEGTDKYRLTIFV